MRSLFFSKDIIYTYKNLFQQYTDTLFKRLYSFSIIHIIYKYIFLYVLIYIYISNIYIYIYHIYIYTDL